REDCPLRNPCRVFSSHQVTCPVSDSNCINVLHNCITRRTRFGFCVSQPAIRTRQCRRELRFGSDRETSFCRPEAKTSRTRSPISVSAKNLVRLLRSALFPTQAKAS